MNHQFSSVSFGVFRVQLTSCSFKHFLSRFPFEFPPNSCGVGFSFISDIGDLSKIGTGGHRGMTSEMCKGKKAAVKMTKRTAG